MADKSFKNSAHDLNNILTSIVNEIELLKQLAPISEETKKLISRLENSAKRASDIVHAHLTPSDRARRNLQKVSVLQIVEEVVESFNLVDKSRFLINKLDNIPTILIDETDLFRMIQNLFTNALEASKDEEIVTVNISLVDLSSKNFLAIEVIDYGVGIPEEDLEKIFKPKFSTKIKEQESGYGLSIVKEKAEEYNGLINVKSCNGETKFTLLFPVFDEKINKSKNILLAEDDLSVCEVLSDLLKSNGYNVSTAVTGHEAIVKIGDSFFDALIIDKKMPEMDGIECIKSIRKNNREIPIILASGSDIDVNNVAIENLNINRIIKKPYNFPEILSALQKFNL